MNRPKRSRRNQATFVDKVLHQIWLVIPIGMIGLVVALAITQGRKGQRSMQSQQQPGLVESFSVTSPGGPLPAQPTNASLPGQQFPNLGQKHATDGETISYNSNPPTSGSHYATAAGWGIYSEAPVDGKLVHNLEHGGVIISYNPAQIKEQQLEQLKAQVREFSKTNSRIILTPRANLDGAIALTAWTYLQKLDRYDPSAVQDFYNAHIARGPECENGQCPA